MMGIMGIMGTMDMMGIMGASWGHHGHGVVWTWWIQQVPRDSPTTVEPCLSWPSTISAELRPLQVLRGEAQAALLEKVTMDT